MLLVAIVSPALALDGRATVSSSWQEGGAGDGAYDSRNVLEQYGLSDRFVLGPGLTLASGFTAQRRDLRSTFAGVTSSSLTESMMPNLGLFYRGGGVRTGLTAQASRRDRWDVANDSTRDERGNVGGWVRGSGEWFTLEFRGQSTASRRRTSDDERESTEHEQAVRAELTPGIHEQLQYRLYHLVQDNPSVERELTKIRHELEFRSSRQFAGRRGRAELLARGIRSRQTTTLTGSVPLVLVPPLAVAVSLDDTPEFLDTMEDDPVAEPGLFDGDLDTPTSVNIGDAAPAVRQYGGDYRNLAVDFGQAESFSRLILYVDRVIDLPELFQWQLHVSDDPEGRDWSTILSTADVSTAYEEFADGRQGWVFSLSGPVEHRRVKLVDVKLGITEPDIFITELEVQQPAASASDREDIERTTRYRLQSGLDYAVNSVLNLSYSLNLDGRYNGERSRVTDAQNHRFGASLRAGRWWLTASHQIDRESRTGRADTEVLSQRVALGTPVNAGLRARVSYSRTDDRTADFTYLTNAATGDVDWTIAPLLTLTQRVTYSERDTRDDQDRARSWASTTRLRGTPRPNLDFSLSRIDRWVSREAGFGFTTFNDTELTTGWRPVPLVSFTSQVVYRRRDDDETLVRHTLSWTPLPGGSMSLRLYALDFRDSRTDDYQTGGGARATWHARRSLHLEAGYELTRLKQAGERNTPRQWDVRGTWTF